MNSKPYTLLIVDDNPNNLFSLHALLDRLLACRVIEAQSGVAALGILLEERVDLVLMDIQMPGMDGFETASHMKMTEKTKDIPVIFITAFFQDGEFVRHGYEIGAVDYLTKPLDDNLLLNRLRLYLQLFEREKGLQTTLSLVQQKEHALEQVNQELEARVMERTRELEIRNQMLEREIAERKAVELELRHAKQVAEEAARAKSDFLATMSHEIRTPMNVVIGMCDVLLDTRITIQQREYIIKMQNAGGMLLELINDILDVSKIEAGQLLLMEDTFDPCQLLNHTVEMMGLAASRKGLELTLETSPDLPEFILGDPVRLRQVVFNLISNAIKFTDSGQISIRLSRDIARDGASWLQMTVQDSGIGISTEKLDCIFEKFTQADSSITRRFGGSGLGLTISRRLVSMMGGSIQVKSRPGEGSTFQVRIPCRMAYASESLPHHVTEIAEDSHSSTLCATDYPPAQQEVIPEDINLNILLADDSEENILVIQAYLMNTQCRLEIVENGLQALEKFKEKRFDLVLMDIQMPVMDGCEATKRIRHWESQVGIAATPIIALTAHAMMDVTQKIKNAGCDMHMTKPVRKKYLIEIISYFQKRRVSSQGALKGSS
ncbi:MAG: response regulator [Magnetococcales bacterium]|nr:response regulator [Magnetococcales bacterium]